VRLAAAEECSANVVPKTAALDHKRQRSKTAERMRRMLAQRLAVLCQAVEFKDRRGSSNSE